jgi:hypothetical protein
VFLFAGLFKPQLLYPTRTLYLILSTHSLFGLLRSFLLSAAPTGGVVRYISLFLSALVEPPEDRRKDGLRDRRADDTDEEEGEGG